MWPTKALVIPPTYDFAVFDKHTADERIRAHPPYSATRKFQSLLHVLHIASAIVDHTTLPHPLPRGRE
jgi:hypothetical protein